MKNNTHFKRMFTYVVKTMITNIYPKSIPKYLPIPLTALAIVRRSIGRTRGTFY